MYEININKYAANIKQLDKELFYSIFNKKSLFKNNNTLHLDVIILLIWYIACYTVKTLKKKKLTLKELEELSIKRMSMLLPSKYKNNIRTINQLSKYFILATYITTHDIKTLEEFNNTKKILFKRVTYEFYKDRGFSYWFIRTLKNLLASFDNNQQVNDLCKFINSIISQLKNIDIKNKLSFLQTESNNKEKNTNTKKKEKEEGDIKEQLKNKLSEVTNPQELLIKLNMENLDIFHKGYKLKKSENINLTPKEIKYLSNIKSEEELLDFLIALDLIERPTIDIKVETININKILENQDLSKAKILDPNNLKKIDDPILDNLKDCTSITDIQKGLSKLIKEKKISIIEADNLIRKAIFLGINNQYKYLLLDKEILKKELKRYFKIRNFVIAEDEAIIDVTRKILLPVRAKSHMASMELLSLLNMFIKSYTSARYKFNIFFKKGDKRFKIGELNNIYPIDNIFTLNVVVNNVNYYQPDYMIITGRIRLFLSI